MGFKSAEVQEFLGKGITLPLRLQNGSVPLDSDVTLIRSSIKMILSWLYGTRFFLCEFGSRIEELLEEPNDDVLLNIAYTLIVDSLRIWEKRIEVIEVELERPEFYKVNLKITYKIITSQKTDTFVYPFYQSIET